MDIMENMNAEKVRRAKLARVLAARGDVADVQRYERGLMSEDEQRGHLRASVFRPLDGLERYEKLYPSDVPHEDAGAHCVAGVYFTSYDCGELAPAEFAVLAEIEGRLRGTVGIPMSFTVTPREHCASCGSCGRQTFRRSIRVQMGIGDWMLTREYAAPQGVAPVVAASVDRGDEPTVAAPAQRVDPHPAGSPSGLLELAIHILVANAQVIDDPRMGGTTECYAVPLEDVDALRDLLAGTISETLRGRG